jgi:HEPN domain-containing protein
MYWPITSLISSGAAKCPHWKKPSPTRGKFFMSEVSLARDWLQFAHNDLISARHLFEDLYPKQIQIACYHSQQCAEKALKAYLYFRDIKPPHIHDLEQLCQSCIEQDASFSEIVQICSKLTPYGVVVRYPGGLDIDETLAGIAIERAQIIYDFCALRIPETP